MTERLSQQDGETETEREQIRTERLKSLTS